MSDHADRVCIIGAGPSGLSALYHFNKLQKSGVKIPEVVCYEKQSDIGGQWNFSWELYRYIAIDYLIDQSLKQEVHGH